MDEWKRRWALVGLTWLAFILRVVGLSYQSLWRDEVDAIRFAGRSLGQLLEMFSTPGENGPLYYLLLRPWLDLAGQSEFALRFFSAVLGVLAVLLIYRLGRRLFRSEPVVAWLAALLAATSPYLVWYSQEGKMYALVVVLVLLAMERYLAALEQGGWHRWLGYVLITSAALYVHLVAALIIPVQIVAFFAFDSDLRSRRWRSWLLSLAMLTLPYLPLLAWQLPLLQLGESGFDFVPLHQMAVSLLASYSLGVLPGAARWWLLVPFVGALLASLLLFGWGERPRRSLLVLLAWLLLPVIGLFLITLVRPLYTARYLIFVLPASLLLLAGGVLAVAQRSRLVAAFLLLTLLAANGRGLWLQATTPFKADFRAATAYVAERWSYDDLLLFQIPYGRHSFDYYFHPWPASRLIGRQYQAFLPIIQGSGDLYRWADGLFTNAGMEPEGVARHMAEITAGSRVVWLVATEVPLWDERGLVQSWLDAHATLVDRQSFVRVEVYRYEFP